MLLRIRHLIKDGRSAERNTNIYTVHIIGPVN